MNRLFLTALTFLIAGVLNGQSFEGSMTYRTEYSFNISAEMEKMGITKDVLIEKMKNEGNWTDSIRIYYKDDNYFMYTSFSPLAWSIYKGETNKIYSFRENDSSGICTVTDASIDLEETMSGIKPATGKTGNIVEIDGRKCDEVRVVWKSGTYDYYYDSTSFLVDPALFENHIYDGWAGYLKIAQALPVRVIKSISGLGTITQTLVSFRNEKVDVNLFIIPELIPDKSLNIIRLANRELMRIKK